MVDAKNAFGRKVRVDYVLQPSIETEAGIHNVAERAVGNSRAKIGKDGEVVRAWRRKLAGFQRLKFRYHGGNAVVCDGDPVQIRGDFSRAFQQPRSSECRRTARQPRQRSLVPPRARARRAEKGSVQ